MLQMLSKFHPGLVGTVAGFSAGAVYSTWWFDLGSAGAGLNESETVWLLAVTAAVLYFLPLLTGYFAYYSYAGIQADSTNSASQSWKTIAIIVFPLGFAHFLSIAVLFTDPASISTATLWSIFLGYATIFLALLYLMYVLPWVGLGRRAIGDVSAIMNEDGRERLEPEAKIVGTKARSKHWQEPIKKVTEQ